MTDEKQPIIVSIPYRNGHLKVRKEILDKYRQDLSEYPCFTPDNVTVHMGFLYSGNCIPVTEFLAWYRSHEELNAFEIYLEIDDDQKKITK